MSNKIWFRVSKNASWETRERVPHIHHKSARANKCHYRTRFTPDKWGDLTLTAPHTPREGYVGNHRAQQAQANSVAETAEQQMVRES